MNIDHLIGFYKSAVSTMESLIENMSLGKEYFTHIMNKYPHATLLNAERIMIRCLHLMDAREMAF